MATAPVLDAGNQGGQSLGEGHWGGRAGRLLHQCKLKALGGGGGGGERKGSLAKGRAIQQVGPWPGCFVGYSDFWYGLDAVEEA